MSVLQMGHFTMDNASNNATFMTHLALLLAERGVLDFNAKENYIRCFAHIINLASQTVIRAMEKQDSHVQHSDTETESESDDDTPGLAVRARRRAGPIRRARKTVAFIRKSGQRRDELLSIIKTGNETQLWTEVREVGVNVEQVPVALSEVTVLLDVKTRGDSVFFMLRHLRYLRQPVTRFFAMNRDAQAFRHTLENRNWDRLEILELVLQQPHTIQTITSSESTPILAATIPAFELFMSSWETILAIARKYYDKFADTNAYIIAMFINPSIRLEWIKRNWSWGDQENAKKIILNKVKNAAHIFDAFVEKLGSSRNIETTMWQVRSLVPPVLKAPAILLTLVLMVPARRPGSVHQRQRLQ
ncbi:ribonuclease H-like domain-containing protein [Mycena rosella]|uniref:Ribonuclease H-like domain-containing protein n=1 Tax=Mycena rosella TaxID=1033263 RepID=A0AAD7D255_MYCRO|nr:ribonuclease H-like domain-containing protein [Mycena rosella]